MKHESLCPICGEGTLVEKITNNRREINGITKLIPLHSSICSTCGTELATPYQTRLNKRVILAFEKEANGLLTGSQVKRIRERLGFTRAEAARIFGGGPVAFNKYENNDISQSVAMDKLIRLASNVPEALEYLKAGCPEVIETRTLYDNTSPYMATIVEKKHVNVQVFTSSSSTVLESVVQQTNHFYSFAVAGVGHEETYK
ncbi:type II toxin-antitoxin system MqsA family antitoxin [Enterobacter sp. FR 78]|uniref:type II toxin-antitoxin system MqsA family antitoxin n=1 Tax=Enterobacter sp. FR 78 TaxID=3021714 RepID=UPI0023A9F4ED|nr:type II toxin-antitoxin system MqsA family antitoxin [Enterobacter sp. FR 78]MDD9581193.1 type II toxin-antitoxin system MqsA family antitoxin [Enterobacter sp. FR 78]